MTFGDEPSRPRLAKPRLLKAEGGSSSFGMDRLVLPVLVLLCLSILAIGGVIVAAARSQDASAARQANRTVEASLSLAAQRLLATAGDYANWDEAVDALTGGDPGAVPDPAWVAANIGPTLFDSFGITGVLLIDDSGKVRLAVSDGETLTVPEGMAMPPQVPALARAAAAAPAGTRGQASGLVGTPGFAHLAAAADLRREITSERPERGAVLVFLRRLDEALLSEIAAPLAVGTIAMRTASEASKEDLPLVAADGAALGSLTWNAPAPASEFLDGVLWLILSIVAVMVALTAIFLMGAQRVAAERLALTEQLRNREVRLSRLVENLPDLVALLRDGRLELLNDGGAALLGVRRATPLIGRRLEDLVSPADRVRVEGLLKDHATLVDAGWQDIDFIAVDGSRVPARLLLLPLAELGGDAVMAVARDLRAETQSQEELRAALARAELADHAKAHFLSNVSHELRTPLNAIIGFSQILKDEMLGGLGNSHYRDYAKDIHDGGMHLLQLVNDLLDVARMDAGRFELREGWIDLPTLVARCVRMVQERASAAGVVIETEVALTRSRLLGDELRLKQAIVNILQNAVRASARGDTVRLTVELDAVGDVVVRVGDRGAGMTPQDVDSALTPFGKSSGRPSLQTSGIGLGLPLAKGYVEAHGGTLSVASTPGVGTTVSLTLPGTRLYHPDLMRA